MNGDPRKRLEELFDGYVEGRLTGPEQEEFERLAPLEPEIAERARDEAALVRALREEGRQTKAPAELMEGVRRAIRPEPAPVRPVHVRRVWVPVAAAAGLAAMVAGGGALFLWDAREEPPRYEVAMEAPRAEPEPSRAGELATRRPAPMMDEAAELPEQEDAHTAPSTLMMTEDVPSAPREEDVEPLREVRPDQIGTVSPGDLWRVRNGPVDQERAERMLLAYDDMEAAASRAEAAELAGREGARVLLDTRWLDTALALAAGEQEFREGYFDPAKRFLVVEPLEREELTEELRGRSVGGEDNRVVLAYRSEPAAAPRMAPPPPPSLETDIQPLDRTLITDRLAEPVQDEEEVMGLFDFRNRDLSSPTRTPPPPPATETRPAPADPEARAWTYYAEAPPARPRRTEALGTVEEFLEKLEGQGAEFLFYTTDRREAFLAESGELLPEPDAENGVRTRGFIVFRFGDAESAGQALESLRTVHGRGAADMELFAAELLYEDPENIRLIVPARLERASE